MGKRSIALALVTLLGIAAFTAGADAQIRVSPLRHEFRFHGALGPGPGRSVSTDGVTVTLSNDVGEIISLTLPPGACVDRGTSCVYRNLGANATTGGISRFRMTYRNGKIWMVSYGDVSAAITPHMQVDVIINTQPYPQIYRVDANFTLTKKGWLLPDNDPQW
jgi:hypothetical protein